MSDESKSVHTSPEEIVGDHVDVAADALTDAIGVVVPGVSSEPSKTEEKADDSEKKEDKAA
jgi:hypothetical protein